MDGLSRRGFLAGTAGAAAAALAARPEPARAAPASSFDLTVRVLGLGYDMPPQILKQAEQDLGFGVDSSSQLPPDIQRRVRQQPATWDIFSCAQQDVAEFWTSRNLQPVEIARITRWKDITPLYRFGRVTPRNTRAAYGQGDAAFRRLYVDPTRSGRWRDAPHAPATTKRLLVQWVDEATGKPVGPEPKFSTGVPATFNFDSFGYNSQILKKQPEVLSWAELLNTRWHGRVGLNGFDPSGGLQDVGNAVQAAGLMSFGDLGDPTRKEIDRLASILIAYRKRGHFYDTWTNFLDPVGWMRDRKVVLCTMYASQIGSLAALNFPVRQAAPREGYRAFGGLLSISSEVKDPAQLDACYRFLNWWHSGFPASVLMRWGYFNAVQSTSRRFTSPDEYGYWIEGKPAEDNYTDPFGSPAVVKGRFRDGGSFIRRAGRISSWNSTPRQQEYFIERWNEFLSGFPPPAR